MVSTNRKMKKFVGADAKETAVDIIKPNLEEKLALVIFAHGFKGFKDWGPFPYLMEKIAESGFCVVSFNFSHNGGTVKDPIDFPDLESFSKNTYSKEVEDIKCLLKWMKGVGNAYFSNCNLNDISLIGHSRGGGISILAGSRFTKIKKLVTWAAVDSFVERLPNNNELNRWRMEGVRYIKNGRTNQQMPMNYEFVEDLIQNKSALSIELAAKKLSQPILIVHGEKDETVELKSAKNLATWCSNSKLVVIEKAGHTFGGKHPFSGEQFPKELEQLLDETINFLKN